MYFLNKKKSILFLGYDCKETILLEKLRNCNYDVQHSKKKIKNFSGYDLVISFG